MAITNFQVTATTGTAAFTAAADVAVTVIDSAVQGKANDLARTFTTK